MKKIKVFLCLLALIMLFLCIIFSPTVADNGPRWLEYALAASGLAGTLFLVFLITWETKRFFKPPAPWQKDD